MQTLQSILHRQGQQEDRICEIEYHKLASAPLYASYFSPFLPISHKKLKKCDRGNLYADGG